MKRNKNNPGEAYRETFLKNEAAANISFVKGSFIAAMILLILWMFYIFGLFNISDRSMILVNIAFPVNIAIYLSFLLYIKTPLVYKPAFKYFLLMQFVLCVGLLNMVIPKHAVLGWAICLAFAAHYYSPKVMKVVFISVLVMMLISIYGAMFIGEWDANLMNGTGKVIIEGVEYNVDDLSAHQRYIYLHDKILAGDNRYLKVLYFYYAGRVAVLTILFIVFNALSKRTLNLLKEESGHVQQVQKISNELTLAAHIQLGVLPKNNLENENCKISAKIIPAKEVGGDFYDFFKIDENYIAFVIADVSGKGVPASLFMMKTETLVKSLTLSHKNQPALIMSRCNKSLCEGNEFGMFVTCWLGILNTVTGELIYCNAGHNSPLISRGKEVIYTSNNKQVVLGAFEDSIYKEESLLLEEGDKLFLYTDGVTESHNKSDELFGEDRLKQLLESNSEYPPAFIVDAVNKEINKHSIGAPQFDDITMLCVEYSKGRGDRNSRSYNANVEQLDSVLEFVKSFFKKYDFDERTINSVGIAVEESFVNVCHYAYKGIGPIDIALIRDEDNDEIFIELKDMGMPFNPLLRDDPKIDVNSDDREIGGLGIFMVKKIMDDVSYKYINKCNVLILGKKRNKK